MKLVWVHVEELEAKIWVKSSFSKSRETRTNDTVIGRISELL